MVAAQFWHRNYGLIALFWALAFLVPFAAAFGAETAFRQLVHVLILEYIPFIALIGALFVIAGGIYIAGEIRATPALNAAVMAAGMVLANFAGTTGAAMILIHPIVGANRHRERKAHVIVFFIFLVCNIGGALTPLGDPPLLLGYLEGVDFSWPLKALWPHMLFAGGIVLAMFFALDSYLYAKESKPVPRPSARRAPHVRGLVNLPLLALVVAVIAASGSNGWGKVDIFGTAAPWKGLLRDLALVACAAASLALTPRVCRVRNEFHWGPVIEVAKLFAAIFITVVPAIAILKAGRDGAFAPLFHLLGSPSAPHNIAYFWLTGILSSFLDNAPAYLVFFNAAGGDPRDADGADGVHAGGDLGGRGVHGREHLYRQCAQPDGQGDRGASRRENAGLPRFHGLVNSRSHPGVRSAIRDLLPLNRQRTPHAVAECCGPSRREKRSLLA